MMKQKVVIKVSMNGHKSRSKAMKIAVGISGVESAALQGEDKSQIEVKGVGIDAVELTSSLRKKVGHAEIISVSSVDEKKEGGGEKKPDDQSKVQPMVWQPPYVPTYEVYGVPVSNHYAEPSCSIM